VIEVNEVNEQQTVPVNRAHPGRQSKRVLIAGDDETSRRELAHILVGVEGLIVRSVSAGQDTLSAARAMRPDAIVMDMRMPATRRYRTMKAIRASPDGLSKIPIIALTEACLSGDIERCIRAGASDYVARPSKDLSTLRAKVEFWSTLGRDEFAG
jgi:two-component system chemotaxis sensor kinase CheA